MELQIKSTEYKAQDDKVTAEQSGVPGEEGGAGQQLEDEDVDVEGFLFSKLKVLNPDLAPKLDKLKQALLDESQELAPLKVWQLQELSLQAAERILSAAKDESLKIMAQLAQNFPLLARSLVRTTVRPALKAEIKRNQQVRHKQKSLPSSALTILLWLDRDSPTIWAFNRLKLLFSSTDNTLVWTQWTCSRYLNSYEKKLNL